MKSIFRLLAISATALVSTLGGNAQNYLSVVDSIDSKILGCVRHVTISVPRSYFESDETTYPVLYLLHGLSDNHTIWEERAQMTETTAQIVAEGKCREVIVVNPEAGGMPIEKVQNGYFNIEGWAYEDFFFNELIPFIEAKYRIKGDKAHRAIAGLSMGGGGTTVYAQHHPEMFCAAHPMSAWLDNKGHNSTSIRKTSPTMKKLINSVCATAPAKFVRKADAQTVEALKTLHWTIECGDDDFLFRQNIELYYAMQDRQIPAELIIRDGTHSWAFWKEGLKHTLIELEGIFAE